MPRTIRNFWVELEVDGQQTILASGPKSQAGGFRLAIKIRDNKTIKQAITITGRTLETDPEILVLEGYVSACEKSHTSEQVINFTTRR